MVRRGAAARSLKARALQWLSQREHSRVELRRKLLRLARAEAAARQEALEADPAAPDVADQAQAEVDTLLDWLQAHRYLSDQRFVESRVHVRAPRFGNLRIQQEIGQHRLELDPGALVALKDSEHERARQVWQRKFAQPARDAAEQAKQARFLVGRGFTAEVIRRVLREGAGRAASGDQVDKLSHDTDDTGSD